MLADVAELGLNHVLSAGAGMGLGSALVWFLITKEIPRMRREHTDAIVAMTTAFTTELRDSRKECRDERAEADRQRREDAALERRQRHELAELAQQSLNGHTATILEAFEKKD